MRRIRTAFIGLCIANTIVAIIDGRMAAFIWQ